MTTDEADVTVLTNARGQVALMLGTDPGPVGGLTVRTGGGAFRLEADDGRTLGTVPISARADLASAREVFLTFPSGGRLEQRPVALAFVLA